MMGLGLIECESCSIHCPTGWTPGPPCANVGVSCPLVQKTRWTLYGPPASAAPSLPSDRPSFCR